MSRKISEAFPGKRPGIKAPSIVKLEEKTRGAPPSGGGAKPNWRQQRELEEQRKREAENRLRAEKEARVKDVTANSYRDQTVDDPILNRIKGGYSLVEEDVVVELQAPVPQSTPAPPAAKVAKSTNTAPPSFSKPATSYSEPPSFSKPATSYSEPPSYSKPATSYSEPPKSVVLDNNNKGQIQFSVGSDNFQHSEPKEPPHVTLSEPVNEPPPKNIVVSGPSSGCPTCGLPLSGAVVTVKGEQYHQNCFICAGCKKIFTGHGMVYEIEGKPHCGDCKASKTNSPSLAGGGTPGPCAKCGKEISGSVLEAVGKLWHQHCFTCAECDKPFESSYIMYEGKPHCRPCSDKLAELESEKEIGRCGGCGLIFKEGKIVNVNGTNYHPNCFKCTGCGQPFESEYFSHENKPYCAKCIPS